MAPKINFFRSFFEVPIFYRFWSVLGGFGEGFGRVWGEFWKGLGRVWGGFGKVLGMKFSSHWRNEGRPADCALRLNKSLGDDDQFCPKIIKIGAILSCLRQVSCSGPGSRENDAAEAAHRGRTTQRWCSKGNSAIQRLGPKACAKTMWNAQKIQPGPAPKVAKSRLEACRRGPKTPTAAQHRPKGTTEPSQGPPREAKSGQEMAKSSPKPAKTARRGQNSLQKGRRRH